MGLEEVGTNKAEIIARNKDWIYYDLPKEFIPMCWNGKYSGQKQRWFLMKFSGKDQDININYTDHPEFKEWSWQNVNDLVTNAISFKRQVYRTVIEEFSSVIKASIID